MKLKRILKRIAKKIQIVNKPLAWFVIILSSVGLTLCLVVSVLAIFKLSDWSTVLGIISTVISIILGLISIAYTFVSGQETLKALDDIEKKYSDLCEMNNAALLSTNLGESNIKNIKANYGARLKEEEEKREIKSST